MLREISLAEVKRHNSSTSDWIVIHNEVYDVTKYLSEHPGGEDTLLEVAGQVATQNFEDIGHSDDAREIMKKYKIGALPANEHSIATAGIPEVGSNWWKWALLILAGAITVGLIAKKKMG